MRFCTTSSRTGSIQYTVNIAVLNCTGYCIEVNFRTSCQYHQYYIRLIAGFHLEVEVCLLSLDKTSLPPLNFKVSEAIQGSLYNPKIFLEWHVIHKYLRMYVPDAIYKILRCKSSTLFLCRRLIKNTKRGCTKRI